MAKDKGIEALPVTNISVSENEIIIEEVDPQEVSETASRGERKAKPGNIVSIWMGFQIQGLGSFTCGGYNTATGANGGWFKFGFEHSHRIHKLYATPAPNYSFSHWLFNGNYAGSNRQHSTRPLKGLIITAVFNPK